MANFGVDLELSKLTLVRGRDFKWAFQNLDENAEPIDFPDGQLFFEIQTGGEHDATQTIAMSGTSGGTYTVAIDGHTADALPFDASQDVVRGAIESLPNIGTGNVAVSAWYLPTWTVVVDWGSLITLDPFIVQAFNTVVTLAFEAFSFLNGIGIQLNGIYSPTTYTFTITCTGPLSEVQFVNMTVSTVAGAIISALNAAEQFTGKVLGVTEYYEPQRVFNLEFINDKALTPISKIAQNGDSLTGRAPSLTVDQTAPGRAANTIWDFDIDQDMARLKVESEDVNLITNRTKWQLVWLAAGEDAGGDPQAHGYVLVQN